jgi:hypothetical protein
MAVRPQDSALFSAEIFSNVTGTPGPTENFIQHPILFTESKMNVHPEVLDRGQNSLDRCHGPWPMWYRAK